MAYLSFVVGVWLLTLLSLSIPSSSFPGTFYSYKIDGRALPLPLLPRHLPDSLDNSCRSKRPASTLSAPFSVWVDVSSGSDANPGTQEEPFQSMSPAIALLGQFPNLTVRVAPGVYTGSSNWGFKLTNGSSLTIAGIPSTVDDAENLALPVFDLAGASFFLWNLEVDNFTAAFSDLEFTNGNPGVLDFLSTDFTGENLVFSNTSGTPPLSVEDGSVELANCSFVDSQQPRGAGFFAAKRVSSVSLKGCLFEGGFAPQGGALSFVRFGAVSIDSCTFRGNH